MTNDLIVAQRPSGTVPGNDLRRFAVDEKRCWQFWGFAVASTDHDLTLRWDGPPNTAEILDHLGAFFNGDARGSALILDARASTLSKRGGRVGRCANRRQNVVTDM